MIELINRLALKNIRLSVIGKDLKVLSGNESNALTEDMIREIRNNKKALIDYLNQYASGYDYERIERLPESADFPVSDGQRRLWLIDQLETTSLAYHLLVTINLNGNYSAGLLQGAIQKVIERHEILRTVFRENAAGELRQLVLPSAGMAFTFQYIDMEGRTPEDADGYIRGERINAFDLRSGPLLKAGLVKLCPDQYIFHCNMPHIIGDGWSMKVLLKEIMIYYEASTKGENIALPPLTIQYRDYAAWQQKQLQNELFAGHRRYWLEQLSGIPVLELPVDKARPPLKTYRGHFLSTIIKEGSTQMLRDLCRRENATLFMGLVSILNVLFFRYSGQKDITIGSPVAGRDHAELEDQIGFYVNTLALRTWFNEKDSFSTLLKNVRSVTLAAYEHQAYPFDRLIGELNIKRDMSRSVLFDVFIALHNQYERVDRGTGVTALPDDIMDIGPGTVKFDISFDLSEIEDQLHLVLEYNTDIYLKSTIISLIEHFRRILELVVANPEVPVGELDYLSLPEKEQLIRTFNDNLTPYPQELTMLDLFKMTLNECQDRTAITYEERQVNYGQLNQWSDQVAFYLEDNYWVKPGQRIGVKLERDEWMVILLLGIMKTGGAYVPIDPSYPQERVDFMLEDSQCHLLIDQELLSVIRTAARKEERKDRTINRRITPGDLAYMLYTSGSTGQPKGVLIDHAALYNYLLYCRETYFAVPDKRYKVPFFTSLSFDLTVTSVFGTLTNGGELMVYPQQMDVQDILEDILWGEKGINLLKCTPVHIAILRTLKGGITGVSQLIAGGEALKRKHLQILQSINPDIVVYNEYGPTEATVGCIVETIHAKREEEWITGWEKENISIGRPIANISIYILDGNGRLVPVGVAGELYIGGVQVAQGYLDRPELTRERFVESPFVKGQRLYRTGDLGCWDEAGNIAYLGRVDEQVKIRGYRIEPGEVEHALEELPGIGSAIVMPRWVNGAEELSLVGYYTGGEDYRAAELQQLLREKLPEYMIPSYWVPMTQLPMTANGKIDRRALPDLEVYGLSSEAEYVGPRNEVETKLTELLASVLKRKSDELGIDDNFFDLGANSLTLIRMTTRINEQFGLHIKVVSLFQHPTIKTLAENCLNSKFPRVTDDIKEGDPGKELDEVLAHFDV